MKFKVRNEAGQFKNAIKIRISRELEKVTLHRQMRGGKQRRDLRGAKE